APQAVRKGVHHCRWSRDPVPPASRQTRLQHSPVTAVLWCALWCSSAHQPPPPHYSPPLFPHHLPSPPHLIS
ncbi:unnamed protein product, partial [Lampetra planeri]